MATFSISEVLGEGFRVVGRRPLSVLAWGAAYFVLGVLPAGLAVFLLAPTFITMFQQLAHDAATGEQSFARIMALESRLMILQPVFFLSALVARAVLAGAIFRAVLEPQNSAFAYLRLGRQELWLGLLILAMAILLGLVGAGLVVADVAVGAAVAASFTSAGIHQGWTVLIMLFVIAASIGTFVWIALRWSMAPPMTFAAREFRLFESWAFTRGSALKLLGLAFVLWVIGMVIGMVVQAVAWVAILGAAGAGGINEAKIEAFLMQPPEVWLTAVAPWFAVAMVLGAFLTALLATIFAAPWAAAYRQMAAEPPPPEAPATEAQAAHAA